MWFLENIITVFFKTHSHTDEDHHHDKNVEKTYVFLLADFFHNVTDGIAIGASFLISKFKTFLIKIIFLLKTKMN